MSSRERDELSSRSPVPLAHATHYETVLEAKREEFMDDALIYAKSLREGLEISFEPPRRIRRKHIFCNGSKDA
ncbi:hypothetical protein TNCV_4623281 [Trichonephila clavipes]|nr:hypothetical protein TNCV_4623281 [Trichonephila clavipes]